MCDGDCDDNDPTRSPGAADVACNDIDEDCSGADQCKVAAAAPATRAPWTWLLAAGALLHIRVGRSALDLDVQPRT